ncbi:MAG TPA: hypothetical protein PKD55_20215 [Bellilinea sp.]|nr:hypothetical protein [Bellilinea sp.]
MATGSDGADLVTLAIGGATVKRETDRALLVDLGRGGVWLPKSLATVTLEPGQETGTLTLPRWLLRKKFGL